MIGDLLEALVGYPTLSRTATTALADICDSIKDNATSAEIQAVLEGAMTEEASVRFACVQALQPLDLTELDFAPSLWIAAHDEDERNRQLAITAWEDNGLDVPDSFVPLLIPFLGESINTVKGRASR